MQEQIISFETAKLAKEKGFDWECNHSWDDRSLDKIDKTNELVKHSKYKAFNTDDMCDQLMLYSAPTQSILQKWLREVHGLFVNVEHYENKAYRRTWTYSISTVFQVLENYNFEDNRVLTYEEALEEGLQEALKNI
jgi:hypothetical protein